MHKRNLIPLACTILFLTLFTTRVHSQSSNGIEVSKIWDQGLHQAFTDLVRFNNAFYCVFREGSAHVKGWDGKARILKSTDGKNWKSVALLTQDGKDIRDPKISITPDNRLMVLMDVEGNDSGKVNSRKPFISLSDKLGNNFSAPKESTVDPTIVSFSDWLWRVTWYKGTGYTIDYQAGGHFILKTRDGSSFEKLSKIDIGGYPNESTIRFDKKGKMYVLIRREQADKMGVMATSNPPYQDWKFDTLKQRLGGPNFIFLDDNTLLIGSRLYPANEVAGEGLTRHRSALFVTDLKGNIKKTIELPSGGDCSYPGLVIYNDKLWYSYYSSHEGKTSIYLATIPLSQIRG